MDAGHSTERSAAIPIGGSADLPISHSSHLTEDARVNVGSAITNWGGG